MIPYSEVCGKGTKKITFDEVSPEDEFYGAAEDADMTLRLWMVLETASVQEGTRVYERLERPLIHVLAKMEAEGIKVDRNALSKDESELC